MRAVIVGIVATSTFIITDSLTQHFITDKSTIYLCGCLYGILMNECVEMYAKYSARKDYHNGR